MRPFLRRNGWEVHSLDLIPNDGSAGLEMLAEQIAAYADSRFSGEQSLDLVAFSMGGLAARYYVQRLAGAHRVDKLITISTPHRGTWTAFLRGNAGVRQMRPGSAFLRSLNADMHVFARVKFVSIWTPLDLMIIPASSSVMREARSMRCTVAAHPLMVRDGRVLRLVREALLQHDLR